jgi:enterochelin esterase family protein
MPRWNSFTSFLNEARAAANDGSRQTLVDSLLQERPQWPWVEGRKATFIYNGTDVKHGVALNLDTIKSDPPFDPLTNLEDTSLWFVTRTFEDDDLLDYLLAIDDPMTPLAQEADVVSRVAEHWQPDGLNPLRMTVPGQSVSVLRMPNARPFADWTAMPGVPRGRVLEHTFSSAQLGVNGRKLWVYTPPGYDESDAIYPLLILMDGQWANGPLQVPHIADALIKHGRMAPALIAMVQSAEPQHRIREYVGNDRQYGSLLLEVLPLVQVSYRIDPTRLGLGGVDVGAVAAAHAELLNPAVFSSLILISPPMGKGADEDLLQTYSTRFRNARVLPSRIFQSVGRYEARNRFLRPAEALRDILRSRPEVDYRYYEIGSGHGLVGFRSILPEALAWAVPVPQAVD